MVSFRKLASCRDWNPAGQTKGSCVFSYACLFAKFGCRVSASTTVELQLLSGSSLVRTLASDWKAVSSNPSTFKENRRSGPLSKALQLHSFIKKINVSHSR